MMMMLSRRLTCLMYSRYSSCPRRIFHLQRIVPKTAVVGSDGVENGRFNATDGDDNFITVEAAANDCRLRRIDNYIGGVVLVCGDASTQSTKCLLPRHSPSLLEYSFSLASRHYCGLDSQLLPVGSCLYCGHDA